MTQKTMEQCSVGQAVGKPCHLSCHKVPVGLIQCTDLSTEEKIILNNRTAVSTAAGSTICKHHKVEYLTEQYTSNQKNCCDPFERHTKPIKGGLRKITLQKRNNVFRVYGLDLVCGKKLCVQCRNDLSALDLPQVDPETDESHTQSTLAEMLEPPEKVARVEVPPIITEPLGQEVSDDENEDTIFSVNETEKAFEEFQHKYENVLNLIHQKQFKNPHYVRQKLQEIKENAEVLLASGLTSRQLEFIKIPVQDVKNKILELARRDICQLLSILPEEDWPVHIVIKLFGVTRHVAERAFKENGDHGFLMATGGKRGSRILVPGTEELVLEIYGENAIS